MGVLVVSLAVRCSRLVDHAIVERGSACSDNKASDAVSGCPAVNVVTTELLEVVVMGGEDDSCSMPVQHPEWRGSVVEPFGRCVRVPTVLVAVVARAEQERVPEREHTRRPMGF